MAKNECKRCYISGRVQGVFYRASTQDKAQQLGITGYARNLPDRRVEVLACGSMPSLEEFVAWLWQGPQFAEVTHVECQSAPSNNCPVTFAVL